MIFHDRLAFKLIILNLRYCYDTINIVIVVPARGGPETPDRVFHPFATTDPVIHYRSFLNHVALF